MTPDMFAGWHPDTHRIRLAPRIPLPASQTTHVAAAFSPDMVEGHQPPSARPHVIGKFGWHTSQPTFVVQMTPEMFAGLHPDSPRIQLGPRIPLPIAQTSHVAAAFTPDMVTGQKPDAGRPPFVAKTGWSTAQTTHIPVMTPDMFKGWQPTSPQLAKGPHIPLPDSQVNHVEAPFGFEMVQGAAPPTHRIGRVGQKLLSVLCSILESINVPRRVIGLIGTVRDVGTTADLTDRGTQASVTDIGRKGTVD
jgi:hypothetical protein